MLKRGKQLVSSNHISICFSAVINGASPLKEPQEFWLDSNTKIFVPMMTVTGIFKHKNLPGLSIVKIPLSKSVFLLLLQPSSELPRDKDLYSFKPSFEWLQDLQSKYVHTFITTLGTRKNFVTV